MINLLELWLDGIPKAIITFSWTVIWITTWVFFIIPFIVIGWLAYKIALGFTIGWNSGKEIIKLKGVQR